MSTLKISVQKPCSENWDSFEKSERGGYCSSCQKTVIDFTKYSDHEIFEYFRNRKGDTCGRFRQGQLKVYSNSTTSHRLYKAASILTAGVLTIAQAPDAYAQGTEPVQIQKLGNEDLTRTNQPSEPGKFVLTGKVVDDSQIGIPGVNIFINDTNIGTISDGSGNFSIIYTGIPREINIKFLFIGMISEERNVDLSRDPLTLSDVVMKYDQSGLDGEVVVVGYACARRGLWHRITSIFRRS